MKSYEKEYRHCLENSNKMELVDKIIYDEKEIERLNKIIEDIKKFIKGYDMDLLTYDELQILRSIELILDGVIVVKDDGIS